MIPDLPVGAPRLQLDDGSFLDLNLNVPNWIGATSVMTSDFDICYPLATSEQSRDAVKSLYH